MRIGLIADIHGNLVALDTVLTELDRAGVDQVTCLGDLAVMGPQPAEVIDRIRERGIVSVCGNTDAWLVSDHPIAAAPPDSAASIALTNWTISKLDQERIAFLRRLPLMRDVSLGYGQALRCFHATPASVDDITHAGQPAGVGEWPGSNLMCCGHTHIQSIWSVGEQRWINPGSVGLPGVGPGAPGLPLNRDVSWAEYAIVAVDQQRTVVTTHRMELDLDRMWAAVQATNMPHQAWWREIWSS